MKEEEEEGDSGKRRREGDRKEGRKEIKRYYRKGSKTSPWKSEIIGLKIVRSGSKAVEFAVLKMFIIRSKFYK